MGKKFKKYEKKEFNALQEQLISSIMNSIENSDGDHWKKEWICKGMPVNGITNRPFTGATEFNLFQVQTMLQKAFHKEGNRWFTRGAVVKYNLWDPKYIYAKRIEKETEEWGKGTLQINYQFNKEEKRWYRQNLFFVGKKVKNSNTKWEQVGLAPGLSEDYSKELEAKGYKKTLDQDPVFAYASSPYYKIMFAEPDTEGKRGEADYFYSKALKREIFFQSELKDAIEEFKEAHPDIPEDNMSIRQAGEKVTALYHESQLDLEKINKLKVPAPLEGNKQLKDLDISDLEDVKKAIDLKDFIMEDSISQGRAYYSPDKDEIVLPSKDSFKSKEALFATAFHEFTHSTGAKSRLDRKLGGGYASKDYAKEELIAEIGSIFLCNERGINSDEQMQNHGEYLRGWLKSATTEQDKKSLKKEILSAVYKASSAKTFIDKKLEDLYKSKDKTKDITLDPTERVSENLKIEEIKSAYEPISDIIKEEMEEKALELEKEDGPVLELGGI